MIASKTRTAAALETARSKLNGMSSPLGATPSTDGINFSFFSKHATGVELLLFDRVGADYSATMHAASSVEMMVPCRALESRRRSVAIVELPASQWIG